MRDFSCATEVQAALSDLQSGPDGCRGFSWAERLLYPSALGRLNRGASRKQIPTNNRPAEPVGPNSRLAKGVPIRCDGWTVAAAFGFRGRLGFGTGRRDGSPGGLDLRGTPTPEA